MPLELPRYIRMHQSVRRSRDTAAGMTLWCHVGNIKLFPGNFLDFFSALNFFGKIKSPERFIMNCCRPVSCFAAVSFWAVWGFWVQYPEGPLDSNSRAAMLLDWYPVLLIHPWTDHTVCTTTSEIKLFFFPYIYIYFISVLLLRRCLTDVQKKPKTKKKKKT